MSEDLHSQVLEYLRSEFVREAGRQCVRLELASAQPGLRGEVLRTWDRAEDPDQFSQLARIEELATSILRISEAHADSFGAGQHRFEVRTEQHLGARQKFAFRLMAGGGNEGSSGGEDPPTATGMLAQQMRHNELHMRMLAQMYQTTLGTMQRQVHDLSDETARLRRERVEHYNELEDARSRRDERELAGMRQLASEQRKDLAFGKLLQFAPVVASKLLGSGNEASGAAATPLTILVGELASSLTSEQVAHIASSLTPSQQMLFGEAIREAMRANAESKPPESAKAQGAPTSSNGARGH